MTCDTSAVAAVHGVDLGKTIFHVVSLDDRGAVILVVISHDDPSIIPANRVVEWAEREASRPMSSVSSRP